MWRMDLDVIILILVGLCLATSGSKVSDDDDDDNDDYSCPDIKRHGLKHKTSYTFCTDDDDCLDTEKCCTFNSQMFCIPKISKGLTGSNEEKESQRKEDDDEKDYDQCEMDCPWSVGQIFLFLICLSGAVICFLFLVWLIRRKLNDNTRVGDVKKVNLNKGLSDVESKQGKEKSDPNLKGVHQNWISDDSKLPPPYIIDAPPAYTPFPNPSDKTKY